MKGKGKATKTQESRANNDSVEPSTSNVFADLGFQDSEERLLKARLTTTIAELIEKKDWTQAQIAAQAALDPPNLSRLLRGQLSGFSVNSLLVILNRLGADLRTSAKSDITPR